MTHNLLRTLVLCCGSILAAPLFAADTAPALPYVHLYSDGAGVSHFKPGALEFKPLQINGHAGPMAHLLSSAEGATLVRLESGGVEDWHTVPRKFLLVVLQGSSEVSASDGDKRTITPGMVVLMEDTTGKGHQTRALGKDAHVVMLIPVK